MINGNAEASATPPQSNQAPRAPRGYTVIIPTYNRSELLKKALESVQKLVCPATASVDVLIIDNNSTDDTARVCETVPGPYAIRRVVETRQGLNYGRNRGLVEAKEEFLVYLDDDMEVESTWLVACADALGRNQVHAVCGPVYPNYQDQPKKWQAGVIIESVSSKYSLKGDQVTVVPSKYAHELPGCNFGVWKEAAIKIGGFHPNLDRCGAGMLAGGDFEFGHRLVSANGSTIYVPGCAIKHLVSSAKTSLQGLAHRWAGAGATERALKHLRGVRLDKRERLIRIRMLVLMAIRGSGYAAVGNRRRAVEMYLSCQLQLGYLGFNPVNMKPIEPSDRL
jgi:glycosyltransferase involved in cell wall biosynthesis